MQLTEAKLQRTSAAASSNHDRTQDPTPWWLQTEELPAGFDEEDFIDDFEDA
jgi:hypothetical protein